MTEIWGYRNLSLEPWPPVQQVYTHEEIEQVRWTPTAKDLAFNLAMHHEWNDSGGINGQRADLSEADLGRADLSKAYLGRADLSGAYLWEANLSRARLWKADLSRANLGRVDLSETNLVEANLSGANLEGADLSGANLVGADLSGALLGRADLSGADVRQADLSGALLNDANLKQVISLQAKQLRGANVSLASFPDAIKEFEGLNSVKEATQNARKLFVSVLVACAYAALAITLTAGGPGTIELPIIGLGITTDAFFFVTPVLLALLFGYFHLQMQRLWEELAELPAIFPDGKPLDRKVHPWLITGIVRAHVTLLKKEPSIPFFPQQWFVAVLLAWFTVPITLGYFASAYPAASSGWGLFLHLLTAATLSSAIAAYRKGAHTLDLQEHEPFPWTLPLVSLGFWISAACILVACIVWWYHRLYTLSI